MSLIGVRHTLEGINLLQSFEHKWDGIYWSLVALKGLTNTKNIRHVLPFNRIVRHHTWLFWDAYLVSEP